MPDRADQQVSVSCPAPITRLVHDSGRMLSRIDRLTAFPARLDFGLNALHAGAVFLLVVERGDHDMATFPPLRVISVLTDYEALDAVVFGVHARHRLTVTRTFEVMMWSLGWS